MNAHFASLPGEALLHISGPDTLTFLQGQTTCDTRMVNADRAVPGAYCTPQGRVVCDFLLAALGDDHYGLRLRRDLLQTAATTFGKYIVFSRAELADRDDWQVYALWGDAAAAAVRAVLGELPASQYGIAGSAGLHAVQLDAAGQQFELWLQEGARPDIETALADAAQPADEADWRAVQIRAGIGRVEQATSGQFLPQDLNYDRTGFVNFRKGCYTGQEIVARLHYRGKPKRRSYPVLVSGDGVAAGDALYTANSEQSVGNIVNAAGTDDATVALACIAATALDSELYLGASGGAGVSLLESPYPLSDSDTEE